ncbi:helix-turn-helix transcriptional regulator [Virgisporangium aliadipatigenens]|uniref:Helix-turn-helix transcriptional regulator n=1 Tax=Virgisporangium aliadipatigenens TaxID=741659 RepID=A0A8J3YQU6_9ACTN|nr:response regulator transcription factor [Virgisporangium aliadipatigenens]GIJ48648.1 helix-turn-helix transcriptional regulator [Virgisporangium aliadipatigenens]
MDQITVYVHADDAILQAGLASQLRPRPEVRVVEAAEAERAQVALVVSDRVSEPALRLIRTLQRNGTRLVLVVAELDDADLVAAVEAGVAGVVRRTEASPERLIGVVRSAAAGEGALPPDLLGRLLNQVGKLQRQVLWPRGLTFGGLADREIEVLRLVADGLDTAEIAAKLSYSQRTIKNILHDVTSRLHLRNRSHAVAYALRQGLI